MREITVAVALCLPSQFNYRITYYTVSKNTYTIKLCMYIYIIINIILLLLLIIIIYIVIYLP